MVAGSIVLGGTVMSDKKQALFEMLSKAYSSPAVKADAKLKQIIESNSLCRSRDPAIA